MIKTLQEVKALGLKHHEYRDDVYSYETQDGVLRLIIDGKDVLENKRAIDCHYYENGVHEYKTKDGYVHLSINGKDVLENLKAIGCLYFGNDEYDYETKDVKLVRVENG